MGVEPRSKHKNKWEGIKLIGVQASPLVHDLVGASVSNFKFDYHV